MQDLEAMRAEYMARKSAELNTALAGLTGSQQPLLDNAGTPAGPVSVAASPLGVTPDPVTTQPELPTPESKPIPAMQAPQAAPMQPDEPQVAVKRQIANKLSEADQIIQDRNNQLQAVASGVADLGSIDKRMAESDKKIANLNASIENYWGIHDAHEQEVAQQRQEREQRALNKKAEYETKLQNDLNEVDKAVNDSQKSFFGEGAGGVFSRVAAAIAVGVGGFGSALLGQRNSAMDILQAAKNDFVAKQRARVADAREKAKAREQQIKGIDDDLRTQDERDAVAEARYWRGTQNIINRELQKITNEEQKKQALGLLAQAQQKEVEAAQKFVLDKTGQELQAHDRELQARRDARQAWLDQQKLALDKAKTATDKGKDVKLNQATVEKFGAAVAINDIAKELGVEFKQKTGGGSFFSQFIPGSDARMYNDKREAAIQQIVSILSGKGVTEGEAVRIATSYVPEATDSQGRARGKIDNLVSYVNRLEKSAVREAEIQGYPNPSSLSRLGASEDDGKGNPYTD